MRVHAHAEPSFVLMRCIRVSTRETPHPIYSCRPFYPLQFCPLVNDESPQKTKLPVPPEKPQGSRKHACHYFLFFFPFYIASYHNSHFERCTETCTFPFPQVQTVDRPHRLIHRQLTFSQSIHANLQKIANRPTSNSSNLDSHNRANYRQKSPSCWESIRTRLKMENHLPL